MVVHIPPETPESLKAWDEALDVFADAVADKIIFEAWKEVTIENGGDPSNRDLVPLHLWSWWRMEYDPEYGKTKRKRLPTKRERV